MYVYRMTATTADGTVVELPWETVKVWCDKLGVKHVPDLEKFIYTTPEDLKERANKHLSNMPADEIGKTHVAEGVVVRIDNRSTFTAYKDKLQSMNLEEMDVRQFAAKETEKMFSGVDTYHLLKYMTAIMKYPETTLVDKIHYQQELLGYIDIKDARYKGVGYD